MKDHQILDLSRVSRVFSFFTYTFFAFSTALLTSTLTSIDPYHSYNIYFTKKRDTVPFQVSLLASKPKQYVTDIKLQELAQVIATTFVYLIRGGGG